MENNGEWKNKIIRQTQLSNKGKLRAGGTMERKRETKIQNLYIISAFMRDNDQVSRYPFFPL